MWSSRWLFVLAAAGSAVGLGNIWKFPYIAGENGGGAFIVVYLGCVALVGIPIMMAEVLLGRDGRRNPINTMQILVKKAGASRFWTVIGWMGALAGFLILSYYAVIAGWALYYVMLMADGSFANITPQSAQLALSHFQANPWAMIFWQTVFLTMTIYIVSKGVVKGLETAIKWFMPLLFVLLVILLGYSLTSGGFQQGFDFMFNFNWSAMRLDGFLVALGQAFFTLSLGMGAIMAYGAYMPAKASISNTVVSIAVIDTLVAIAAGLAIFPVVFANGLEPGSGPGLMFVTVPLAFGQLPLGGLFGALFFLLVTFAAITSAISLTEPALAYLVEEYNAKRARAAVTIGVVCWILGIGTVLSFNYWSDIYLVGQMTFFVAVDYLTQNIMLPLGGLLIALFTAYVLPKETVERELGLRGGFWELLWQFLIKFVAPLGLATIFVYTLYTSLA